LCKVRAFASPSTIAEDSAIHQAISATIFQQLSSARHLLLLLLWEVEVAEEVVERGRTLDTHETTETRQPEVWV